MTRYVRIHAEGAENFAYLLGLFNEAGYSVDRFAGGNEFYVPEDLVVSEELRGEIAGAVRPGSLPAQFTPSGEGGVPSAPPAPTADDVPAGVSEVERRGLPPLPPKAGAGSGRAAWAAAAEARGLSVTDDMSRDDIIDLVEDHLAGEGSE